MSENITQPNKIEKEELQQLYYSPVRKQKLEYTHLKQMAMSAADIDAMPPMSCVQIAPGAEIIIGTGHAGKDINNTKNTGIAGDWVMSGPSGENYVVKGSKFPKLYENDPDTGVWFPEQSPRNVSIWEGAEGLIDTPWGETMAVKPGDAIVAESINDGKFYRVAREEFLKTYDTSGMQKETKEALSEFKTTHDKLNGKLRLVRA